MISFTQNYNQGILTAIVSFIGVFLVSIIGVLKSPEMDTPSILIFTMIAEAVLFFGKTSLFSGLYRQRNGLT